MSNQSIQTTLPESGGPIVEAWVDGSCLNNGEDDAVAAVGCVIKSENENGSDQFQNQISIERQATNILAEYAAVQSALQRIRLTYSTDVVVYIYNDAETVVRQIQGNYRVRQDHLKSPNRETQESLNEFREWRIEHRSESDAPEIKRADRLAKEAARGDGQ